MGKDFFQTYEDETVVTDETVQKYHDQGYWANMATVDYLDKHAETRGDETAIMDDNRQITWTELQDEADDLATWLIEQGVEAGDRIAYQIPHSVEWFVVRLGIARAGGIAVSMIPRFREEELTEILGTNEAKVYFGPTVFKDYEHMEIATSLQDELDSLETVVGVGDDPPSEVVPFDEVTATDSSEFKPNRIEPDYPDTLSTTSGTTGLPKQYYLPQNSRLCMAKDMIGRYAITEYDQLMVLAPIHQATGELWAYYIPLVTGATVTVTQTSDPTAQWDTIEKQEPSYCAAIPTQMTKMMNAEDSEQYSLESLRVFANAGAPLPQETAEFFEDKGTVTANFYGASDGGLPTAICTMDEEDVRFSTVGKPVPSMELKIVSAAGETLPPGEVGEVVWRGGNQCFGYYDKQDQTDEALGVGGPNEGWFHSNDAGQIDEDGNLAIGGRMDDMIIRGGQNIYPAEITETLMEHDDVNEAVVVGMPDPEYGQRVCAYVVPSGGAEPVLDDITSFLDEAGLAKFKWPERLELIDELPRSPGGKIQKTELQDNIEEKLAEEGVID